jgi:AcrR family transcriptional regulator
MMSISATGRPAPARRGAATRARLLAAAMELTSEGGYSSASVAAIAERAGVSAGALYRHFPSKTDLFSGLFRAAAERELEAMLAAGAAAGTYLERLDAVLTTYATRALSYPRLSWALVYEPVDPRLDAIRLESRSRYREQMADLIRAAIAASELPEQDPETSAAAVVGAMSEALLSPTSPPAAADGPDPELVSRVVALCRRALGAPSRTTDG